MHSQSYGDKQREAQRKKAEELRAKNNPKVTPEAETPAAAADKPEQAEPAAPVPGEKKKRKKKDIPERPAGQ